MARHIELNESLIRAVLADSRDVDEAAARLGVSRRTLYRWLDKLNLRPARRGIQVEPKEAA